jgi:basic membrane protein A and related proteins
VRQRRWSGLAALVAMVLVIGTAAACGDSSSDAATCEGTSGQAAKAEQLGGTDDPDGSDKKVGMVFDVGGLGDKGFNDSANDALQAAAKNMGIQHQQLEPSADGSNRGELLRSLAEDDYGMIVGVGYAFAEDMAKVAADFPDTKFAIVDSVVDAPNVTGLVFKEEQGTFLVGAEAALKSSTGKIGFVGGVDGELIQKFEAGYVAGAKAADPDVEVDVKYIAPDGDVTGFDDPAKGKTIAAGMYEDDVDVVFHGAGKSGLGVFQAAVAADRLAEGTDLNQYQSATADQQKCILTSMLKRVDVAVYGAIRDYVNGDLEGGVVTGDLSNGGIDYATDGGQFVEKAKIDDLKQQIIDGKIEVPSTP